ncbi:MAG: hypothetical protein HY814_13635, partial [Candidatus Riflebacteria bacterium]|nr:hypothetical protein [Candidatus Riflebacteria bacterium]
MGFIGLADAEREEELAEPVESAEDFADLLHGAGPVVAEGVPGFLNLVEELDDAVLLGKVEGEGLAGVALGAEPLVLELGARGDELLVVEVELKQVDGRDASMEPDRGASLKRGKPRRRVATVPVFNARTQRGKDAKKV